jgi:hypothetical protein
MGKESRTNKTNEQKILYEEKPNKDTPLQDLDADAEAGHNNYSGFTKSSNLDRERDDINCSLLLWRW